MNELLNLKFFRLLSEPSLVSKAEIQLSYEVFVKEITYINSSETDYSKVFRMLNHSRIEIDSLGTSSLCESGGGIQLGQAIFKKLQTSFNLKLNY